MAKFKAVVVPPDEVHIVNTGKGQFIHTSLKNPKYWLTPWKKVYKIPLKAIPIRVSVPVSHTGNLQIILEMEIVFKLRDPELAVKSLGGNIDQLKNTVEGTIKASTRQAALKYPIENILDFYSNVTKEGRASVEGLVRELGFDIISFDIMNIHKKKDLAEEPPVPTSGYYGDNGDNVYGVPSETMPVIPPPVGGAACGDNGGMITNPNVPMLPVGGSGENPATPPAQYSTPPFPLAQPGEMPDYREQIQEESTPNFVNPSSLETDQRRTDWQYNQQRNVAINSAFENFQYSRDDLKWSENQQGMNVPAQESNHAAMNDGGNEAALQTIGPMEESYPMMEPNGEMPLPEGQTPMIPASPTLIPASHIQERSGETAMVEETVEEVREVREEVSETYESYREQEVWDADNFVGRIPEERYKKEAEGVIHEIKSIISRIRRKGMVLPPSPINTYLTKITDNIESGHYLDATKLGRECLTYLEETEVLFEDVRDEVIKLQDWISALKTSKVPLGEAEDRFNLVIDLFKNAEYLEARKKAAICRDLLNKKKNLYEEADNAIKEAWQLMKHAAPLGWEVSKARILLDEAKEAAEMEEYEDALEKAQLAQDVIQAHFDSLKGIWLKIREIGDVATKAHEDSLTEIQAKLDKFGEKMDEILTLGVKITPALNEELLEVEDALSRYDIYEAKHLIEDLETTIEELKELHERAKLKYERANLRAEETKSITKDVRPMMYLLGAMDDALKAGDYELVSDLSDEIQELCDTREEADSLFKSLAMMESAGRIAEECKELGMDVIDVNPLLRDGIISFRQGNYQRAESKSELAYKILLEAKARYLVISTRRIIETTEEDLTGPKDDQLIILEDIEWILDRGEPESAMEKLRNMRLSIFEKKFVERLRNAEGKVRWLEEKGMEIDEEKKLVIRAKLSFDEQDFKMATKIINKAIEELDAVDQYERIIEEMGSTVDLIEELDSKGLDVSTVKEKIASYKPIIDSDLDAKSYVTAMGYVQECQQMALDLKKGYDVKLKVGMFEKKLSKLESEGVSAPSIWRLIQKVYKALGDRDVRKALSIVERVEGRIEEEVNLYKKDKALKLRDIKKKAVKSFKEGDQRGALKYFNKAIKLQPRDEKLLYNKAVVLKNLDRHVEAIQLCNRALSLNEDYEQALKLRDTCRNKLRSEGKVLGRYVEPNRAYDYAPLRYSPQEDVGLDFKGIRNLISEIVADLKDQGSLEYSDFSLDDLSDSSTIPEKGNPLIEMMARDLLFNTRKLVEENGQDLDMSKDEIMKDLQGIDALLERGNIPIIIKEIQKIRALLFERTEEDEVLNTWKKIMETRRNKPKEGFPEEDTTDILDRTKPLYEEGDLKRAIELMENARKDVASTAKLEFSEKILLGMTVLNDLIRELELMDIDTYGIKKELVLIKPAIEKKFYHKADDYIQEAYRVGLDIKKEHEGRFDKDKAQKIMDAIENDLTSMMENE